MTLDRPTLRGRLVVVEPLDQRHVDGLLAVAQDLSPHAPWTYVPAAREALERYVAASLAQWQAGREAPFACRDATRPGEPVIGTTRFLDLDYWPAPDEPLLWPPGVAQAPAGGLPDVAELGSTWMARSVHGKGHNAETKLLLLDFAFDVWGVRRITLKTDARNEQSRRAILAIGAQFEGIRRAHVPATDRTARDSAYYSILAAEWPACRSKLQERLARRH
jgi:RimJ/RimL family protein N-acetyltransferase